MSRKRTLSDLLRDTHLGPSAGAHLARAVPMMGVRYPQLQSSTILNNPIVTTAETVVCTIPPFSPSIDSAPILFLASVQVSTGASTTGLQVRIRQGTTVSGSIITSMNGTNANSFLTAGTNPMFTLFGFDLPGIVAGIQYSLTVAQVAATGNGTTQIAALMAFSL